MQYTPACMHTLPAHLSGSQTSCSKRAPQSPQGGERGRAGGWRRPWPHLAARASAQRAARRAPARAQRWEEMPGCVLLVRRVTARLATAAAACASSLQRGGCTGTALAVQLLPTRASSAHRHTSPIAPSYPAATHPRRLLQQESPRLHGARQPLVVPHPPQVGFERQCKQVLRLPLPATACAAAAAGRGSCAASAVRRSAGGGLARAKHERRHSARVQGSALQIKSLHLHGRHQRCAALRRHLARAEHTVVVVAQVQEGAAGPPGKGLRHQLERTCSFPGGGRW